MKKCLFCFMVIVFIKKKKKEIKKISFWFKNNINVRNIIFILKL